MRSRHGKPSVRRRVPVLLLVPALTVAACGGGGDGGDRATVPPRPVTSGPASVPGPAATTPAGPGTGANPARPGGSVPPESTVPGGPPPSALNAFVACMRRHGVHVPEPGRPATSPPAQDPAKTQSALKACIRYVTQAPSGR